MNSPAWQRRVEPYVAVLVGIVMAASGVAIVETGLEIGGARLWEPLALWELLSTTSGRSQLMPHWGELALGSAFQFYGLALVWIGVRKLVRQRSNKA